MAITFRLAWRNIWRNKRRSFLTLAAIAFACGILFFFMSLALSSYETTVNASVSVFQGHAQIQAEGYLDDPQVRLVINHIQDVVTQVKTIPGVASVSSRAFGFALVSSETRTLGAQIVGVDPKGEPTISSIPGLIRKGRFLGSSVEDEAVVGESLAKNLKLSLGDRITFLGQGRDGSVAAAQATVVGIFESGSRDLDRGALEVPLSFFQSAFSMDDSGHAVVVRAASVEVLPSVINQLKAVAARSSDRKLVVHDWDALSPGLRQAINLDMTFDWIFYSSLILIVSFSILNTFLMSVLERTREFGMMLALGMNPLSISALVILESILLTGVGLLFGILLGSIAVTYYGFYGFYVPGSEEIMKLWNLPSAIYPKITLLALTAVPSMIVGVTVFAVLFPALKILRLEPITAMRAT